MGYLCNAPCEKGCRRAQYDAPITIRRLHREVAEHGLDGWHRETPPSTSKTVAVVGGGLAGLSAAWLCALDGHACRVYEKRSRACSALASLPTEQLPREVLDAEIASIRNQGTQFEFNCEVGRDVSFDSLRAAVDALIVACDVAAPADSSVFTAKEDAMLVRAVAHGKAAAQQAGAFLRGLPSGAQTRRFSCQIGRLRPEELCVYAGERLNHVAEAAASGSSAAEARRCLHCDCLKPVSCRLRQYAVEYGIESRVERHMVRPIVAPIQRFNDVLFEPGKCIKCGICVEITQARGNGMGLTFAGRGLASSVHVPFGEPLARGLGEAAAACVRACPTGALAFRNEEETL